MKKYFLILFILLQTSSLFADGEVFLNSSTVEKGTAVILKIEASSEPRIYFGYERILPDFIQGSYVAIIPIDINESRNKEFLDVITNDSQHSYTVYFKELNSRIRYITFRSKKNKRYVPRVKRNTVTDDSLKKETATVQIREKYHPEVFFNGCFILPIKHYEKPMFYGDKRIVRRGKSRYSHVYYHRGVDFSASKGTLVYAAQSGKVVIAQRLSLRGIMVMIDHGLGIYTEYLHLSKLLVKNGQWVKQGEAIGKVGSTGLSTGPHLHWSFIVKGILVNPLFWTNQMIGQIFIQQTPLTKKKEQNLKKSSSL